MAVAKAGLPNPWTMSETVAKARFRADWMQVPLMPHSRDKNSNYRGLTVTVRWTESKSAESPVSVFTASYAVTSEDGKQSPWHHFTALPFATSDTAVVYALSEAHRSIDAQRSAHPQDGSKPRGHPKASR